MSEYVKSLKRERDAVWRAGEVLLEGAAKDHRALTPEETRLLDERSHDLDLLDQRLEEVQQQEEHTANHQRTLNRIMGRPKEMRYQQTNSAEQQLDVAFRRSILDNVTTPIVVGPTERRSGWQPGLERRDIAPLTTGTASGLLGTRFHDRLVRHMVESSAILYAGATVIQSETGEPFVIPKTTSNSTATIVLEGGAIGESEPTIDKVSLTGFKYGFMLYVTYELAQDNAFDLVLGVVLFDGVGGVVGDDGGFSRGLLI